MVAADVPAERTADVGRVFGRNGGHGPHGRRSQDAPAVDRASAHDGGGDDRQVLRVGEDTGVARIATVQPAGQRIVNLAEQRETVFLDLRRRHKRQDIRMFRLGLIAGMLQVMTLGGDDRKLWAYFISASPDGSKGFIRVKYEMIFFMILTFLLSIHFFDNLILMVTVDKGIEGVYDAGNMVLPLIFLQIFLRAVDIPFTYRFGAKKGSIIKMILMVLCAITMLIVIMINIDDLDVIIDGIKDKMAHYSETPLIPAILASTLIAYYISYRISCRLYMKGAELYDK